MNGNDLYNAMGNIGDDIIEQNSIKAFKKKRPYKALIAACLTIVLAVSIFAGSAIAIEAAEYKEAVEFFNGNSLSTEGLTREDIKAIYKDITQKTFSYDKTADVLNTYSIEMFNMALAASDSDSLITFWENRDSTKDKYDTSLIEKSEVWYDKKFDSLSCYKGDELLWEYKYTAEVSPLITDVGIVLYGYSGSYLDSNKAYVSMLDKDGSLLWEYTESDNTSLFDTAVFTENKIVLFGRDYDAEHDMYSTLFTVLGINGEVQNSRNLDIDLNSQYAASTRIGDTYIVANNAAEILFFSLDGDLKEKKTFLDGDKKYHIRDIVAHGEKVWIFTYKIMDFDNIISPEYQEIRDIEIDYHQKSNYGENKDYTWGSVPAEQREKYTKYFQDKFEATIFVCNETGEISKAYTSKASDFYSTDVEIDSDGNLSLYVKTINEAMAPEPWFSSRLTVADMTVFKLTFNKDGTFISKTTVGNDIQYWYY